MRERVLGVGLTALVLGLAACAHCPIKLPGAPAVPPPPAPDDWFRNLSRIDAASLLDANGRVRHPLPEGVDYFGMLDEDVPLVPVPGAVATWGPVSLARDGDDMRRGMRNTRTVGHHSLDKLREDGIFVGDSEEDMQGDALAAMMQAAPRSVGVPAFIPVAGMDSDDWPAVVVTPEILVRFRAAVLANAPGATPRERVERIAAGWGTEVVEGSPYDPAMYVVRVRSLDPNDWLRVAREIQKSNATDGLAQPNLMVHHARHLDDTEHDASPPGPNRKPSPDWVDDPLLPKQWHLQQIGAIDAWMREGPNTLGDPSVIVAILDPNGVEVEHEDLIDNARGHAHWSFETMTADPQTAKSVEDGHKTTSEHGTAAAGLAVGRGGNGIGISGVAPNCGLMGVGLGPTTRDDVWAIDHAWKNGAAVISNSWGYDVGVNAPDSVRCAIARARTLGRDGKGCVVLFSLTNETADNFAAPHKDATASRVCEANSEPEGEPWWKRLIAAVGPSELPTWRPLASISDVMSIGRATNTGIWGNCGYGVGMSMLGPGESTLATPRAECSLDRAAVRGTADITTCDLSDRNGTEAGYNWGTPEGQRTGPCSCRVAIPYAEEDPAAREINNGNYTSCFRGTSAAVPIVAGVAALVISENPDLTGDEVREILETTAEPIEKDTPASDYVWDEVRSRWYSPTRGHGLVNAFAAVEEARRRRLDKLPRIVIEKTAPAEAYVRRPFSFTLTVRNTGKVIAEDVIVRDTVPVGSGFVAVSANGTERDGDIAWTVGNLTPGELRTLTLTCVAPEVGIVHNIASAEARDTAIVEAAASVDVLPVPTLSVECAGPDVSYVGRPAPWSITVTNGSTDPARGVVIASDLPDWARPWNPDEFASGPTRATVEDGRVVWRIGDMEPGAVVGVTLAYAPRSAGSLVNSGVVSAKGAEDLTFEGEITVRAVPGAVSLQVMDVADPIWLGDDVTYVIDVRNQGASPVHDIVIVATLAPEQEFVSAESANGAPHAVAERVVRFEPLGTLAGGARATYRVIVKAREKGDVRFAVTLTARGLAQPVEETESTHQE